MNKAQKIEELKEVKKIMNLAISEGVSKEELGYFRLTIEELENEILYNF